MNQCTMAVALAALAEYAINHPDRIPAVDQAEAELLSQWGPATVTE